MVKKQINDNARRLVNQGEHECSARATKISFIL